ncbi:hypothetical protein Hanom_Chr05g00471471 [Helianthus anomalus]
MIKHLYCSLDSVKLYLLLSYLCCIRLANMINIINLIFPLYNLSTLSPHMYLLYNLMEFNNPNFHQLADNGPNFKNSRWRSQLLTFCKTLDPC